MPTLVFHFRTQNSESAEVALLLKHNFISEIMYKIFTPITSIKVARKFASVKKLDQALKHGNLSQSFPLLICLRKLTSHSFLFNTNRDFVQHVSRIALQFIVRHLHYVKRRKIYSCNNIQFDSSFSFWKMCMRE